jgi:hypothetical protein
MAQHRYEVADLAFASECDHALALGDHDPRRWKRAWHGRIAMMPSIGEASTFMPRTT